MSVDAVDKIDDVEGGSQAGVVTPDAGPSLVYVRFRDPDGGGVLNPYDPFQAAVGETGVGVEWEMPYDLTDSVLTSRCFAAAQTYVSGRLVWTAGDVGNGNGLAMTQSETNANVARFDLPTTDPLPAGQYLLGVQVVRGGRVDFSSLVLAFIG